MDRYELKYRPNYQPEAVEYMREELTAVGFQELYSLDDVDEMLLNQPDKAVLLVINSVCGCAAGQARPGVALALQNKVIPDVMISAFAGMEKKVVEYVRQRFLSDFVPSSPCFALFRNGELEFIMERKDIVDKSADDIAHVLTRVFNEKCSRPGPSISPEKFSRLENIVMCSSNLPRYQGI